jgi:simple sugar transport system permease protein
MKKWSMQGFFKWLNNSESSTKVISSIIAILGGLLVGFLVMLAIDPSKAGIGLWTILTGTFRDGTRSFGQTIHYSVPIILTGISVAFAFRTGLFNIGATGQLTMGAFAAVYVGIKWTFLGPLHWIVAVFAGALVGALWGSIPGLLKAYRNVNEVVASIMLNYIGSFLSILLIKTYIYNQELARALSPAASAYLPRLSELITTHRSSLNFGFIIALIVVAVTHIILNKTTFGYQLKSVGFNRDASRYVGINEKRNIILAMTISGAIAGIAGATMYLVPGRLMTIESSLLQEGFTGIAISLLGLSSPIGVLFAGLFYGALEMGGFFLQVTTRFVPQIIEIIIAVIIYFSALALFFQKYVQFVIDKVVPEAEVGHE